MQNTLPYTYAVFLHTVILSESLWGQEKTQKILLFGDPEYEFVIPQTLSAYARGRYNISQELKDHIFIAGLPVISARFFQIFLVRDMAGAELLTEKLIVRLEILMQLCPELKERLEQRIREVSRNEQKWNSLALLLSHLLFWSFRADNRILRIGKREEEIMRSGEKSGEVWWCEIEF